MGESRHSSGICVVRVSNDNCPVDLGSPVHGNISVGELNACNQVVSYLEVLEADVSHLFCDGSVLLVLITCEVYEVSCDEWVLPVWVGGVFGIIYQRLAGVSSWH